MSVRMRLRSLLGRSVLGAALALALGLGGAIADEPLHEVYFHDLAKTRVGDMIIVQTNPETEVLVFNGGELALESGNLVVIARHARIDADTVIKSFTVPIKPAKPGMPGQGARGADGDKEGTEGGKGASGESGIPGEDGASAGKVVLRIGEVSGDGRLIVDLSGQSGGRGQQGGQGGDGGNGRDGPEGKCGAAAQKGGDGGWGGIGGQGGQGGRGGNGGIVAYSKAMTPLIRSKHFVITTQGGEPGAGGDPGDAGKPGRGGLGGAGALGCGGVGADGAPGGRTMGAEPGRAGSPGGAGTAIEEDTQ
jgi:hypothetical protein